MPEPETAAPQRYTIHIDGKPYEEKKLTFREERELRELIREVREDPHAEIAEATVNEFALALTVIVKKRSDEEYSLEQALDLEIGDVVKFDEKPKAAARPSRRKPASTS